MSPNSYEILSTRVVVESAQGIAIVQRAQTGEFPRAWELPGGKVNPGEDLFTAVGREALEEIGLVVDFVSTEPLPIDEYPIESGKHKGKIYRAFGFLATTESIETTLDDESIGIKWLPSKAILGMSTLTPITYTTLTKFKPLLSY